eukprot:762424-Hanusia_phi.AAC.6
MAKGVDVGVLTASSSMWGTLPTRSMGNTGVIQYEGRGKESLGVVSTDDRCFWGRWRFLIEGWGWRGRGTWQRGGGRGTEREEAGGGAAGVGARQGQ